MKKFVKSFIVVCLFLGVLSGCSTSTSMSYTYDVATEDKIEVKLNTSEKHKLSSEVPFTISKDDEIFTTGMFLTIEKYDEFIASYKEASNVELYESSTKDNIEYSFYKVDGKVGIEYDYFIKIKDSNTAIVLGNLISKESATEMFNLLSFTKK
ncbi:MAG: hypothetical protein RR646_07465 [Erysipelotrichaceae bacterium]